MHQNMAVSPLPKQASKQATMLFSSLNNSRCCSRLHCAGYYTTTKMMEAWGNARGKAYYEADVPPEYPRPRVGAGVRELQRWIRDKYEKRMFLPRDGSVPSLGTSAGASAPAPPVASSSSSPSKRKLSGQRPASVAAPAPEPEQATLAALAPSMDLLSFDAFAAPEPAHTAAAAQTNAAPAVSGFSDFQNVAQPPST